MKGKNSEMLVCQDRECGYRETVSRTSNARCPKCHKKMELRGHGDGQIFVCKCGYKEKLSSFQERRKKEGGRRQQAGRGQVSEPAEEGGGGAVEQCFRRRLCEDEKIRI